MQDLIFQCAKPKYIQKSRASSKQFQEQKLFKVTLSIVTGRLGDTFTRSRAAVVFQVGAVLSLIIFRTVAAEIVTLIIEALGPILARVRFTIIHVQLDAVDLGGESQNSVHIRQTVYYYSSHCYKQEKK